MLVMGSGDFNIKKYHGRLIDWKTNEQELEGDDGVDHVTYGEET